MPSTILETSLPTEAQNALLSAFLEANTDLQENTGSEPDTVTRKEAEDSMYYYFDETPIKRIVPQVTEQLRLLGYHIIKI